MLIYLTQQLHGYGTNVEGILSSIPIYLLLFAHVSENRRMDGRLSRDRAMSRCST